MSDITTGKIRYEVASHLLNVCKSAKCKIKYLQVRLIENVLVKEGEDAGKVFVGEGEILAGPTLYFNTWIK